ncbi:CpsD/CapB family tyrosine-protein kinase [Myxococcota bacterium]|nr:CpsD/CapB family tyrosine-protein kinase [Myxococcota bacterium]
MAKVYDALKRAEEERRRQAGESAVSAPSMVLEHPAAPPEKKRSSFWKRRGSRKGRRHSRSMADEINKRRISLLQPDSYVAEQYRSLRGRIDAMAIDRPIKTIAITSPSPGEGKTTAAINLAAVTALSVGRRVLLVDCDLRRPQVHTTLGLNPENGLAEILNGGVSLEEAIVKVEGIDLDVLGVRKKPDNPSELLGSSKMRDFVAEMANRYDRVILDTPAALGLPDAKAICAISDGTLLVARAHNTSRRSLRATVDELDSRRVLGLLFNGIPRQRGQYGYE